MTETDAALFLRAYLDDPDPGPGGYRGAVRDTLCALLQAGQISEAAELAPVLTALALHDLAGRDGQITIAKGSGFDAM